MPVNELLESCKNRAGSPTPALAELPGVRFLQCSEWSENDYLNEAKLKAFTGGNKITARGMYKANTIEFIPQFKLILDTNYLPKIKGGDHGIWRRIAVIPFNATFKGKDIDLDLPNKLKAESEGILAWLIEGAVEYYKNGLPKCKAVKYATKEYKYEENTIKNFIDSNITFDKNSEISSTELYNLYVSFCEAESKDSVTQTSFGRQLAAKGFEKQRKADGYYYIGIEIAN